jgi:hypothetical protein
MPHCLHTESQLKILPTFCYTADAFPRSQQGDSGIYEEVRQRPRFFVEHTNGFEGKSDRFLGGESPNSCMSVTARSKWPKTFPALTPEQKRISDDFMRYWHEILPRRYGLVDAFNHKYVVRFAPKDFRRTLEIGAGLGGHLAYEKLTPDQIENYVALEIRQNMADEIKLRFPAINVYVGDCQARLDIQDGYFDRILAIHVLEHLPNLSRH